MNTEKAEKEIKKLINSGLKFKYDFDFTLRNKINIAINTERFNLKDIISKLKDGEKITFILNDGKTWNGKHGGNSEILYCEKYDGSIYWENEKHSDWVRVNSDMGTIQMLFNKLNF
jgi:hypothetical protein